MPSKKMKGADSILYSVVFGNKITTGALTHNTWYRIIARASTGSALPNLRNGTPFKTPELSTNLITLAAGDAVQLMTFKEICKVTTEVSAEKGVIETTDSCDYPNTANIPDGLVSLSGSINTMLRFDETTEELIDVSKDFVNRFYDIIEDDGDGTYVVKPKSDEDIYLMILMNEKTVAAGKVENWLLLPAMLSSMATTLDIKDVNKGDFSWSIGQGVAAFYNRLRLNEES